MINNILIEETIVNDEAVLITILFSRIEKDKSEVECEKVASCGSKTTDYLFVPKKTLLFRHVLNSGVDIQAYPAPDYSNPCVLKTLFVTPLSVTSMSKDAACVLSAYF